MQSLLPTLDKDRNTKALQMLLSKKKFREAVALVNEHEVLDAHIAVMFARAGDPDSALQIAQMFRKFRYVYEEQVPIAFAAVSASMARTGRLEEALQIYDIAVREAIFASEDEKTRDRVQFALVESLVAQHRLHDAQKAADDIETDEYQWAAYFAILGDIAMRQS